MHFKRGFTIVELLIVIVVIGILAALVISTYNGVQDRAARAQTVTAVTDYVKGVNAYAVEKGVYPSFTNACLGGSKNPDNRCYQVSDAGVGGCTGSGRAYGNAGFDSAMKPYMGELPLPSTASYGCGGERFAGALYYAFNVRSAAFFVIVKQSVGACPNISGTTLSVTNTQDEIFICRYMLPTLP